MTAIQCPCCLEPIEPNTVAAHDPEMGVICEDCGKGIRDGLEILAHGKIMEGKTVSGIYHGPCGDNGKGES